MSLHVAASRIGLTQLSANGGSGPAADHPSKTVRVPTPTISTVIDPSNCAQSSPYRSVTFTDGDSSRAGGPAFGTERLHGARAW